MRKLVDAFLSMHNFPVRLNVSAVTDAVLYDMEAGLCKKGIAAGEEMIHTFALPPEKKPANENVIVIDAGGTNFRSCLVTFDSNGKPSISEMEKTSMPGVAKELSKKEFFDQFATNLEHLKNKATKIGFCFSYPMQITADGDGILNGFSKEVKAPEVVGCKIGECLSEALVAHGWKRPEKISLINDTVAALLAGASRSGTGFDYSSYIGFILGTGMNAAYIQPDCDCCNIKKQIVVCESGKFLRVNRSDFDVDFDNSRVKVTRKGGNEAFVYFSDEATGYLQDYMKERKEIVAVDGHEDALFLSSHRKRITVRTVENMVKKYARVSTPLKKITPHKLRSTYGTALYQETGDIYLVADVLGHKDVNTTRKHYAELDQERKRGARNKVTLRESVSKDTSIAEKYISDESDSE